jgi:hypothetical protein
MWIFRGVGPPTRGVGPPTRGVGPPTSPPPEGRLFGLYYNLCMFKEIIIEINVTRHK